MTKMLNINGSYEFVSSLDDVIRLLRDDDKYAELADALPDLITDKLETELEKEKTAAADYKERMEDAEAVADTLLTDINYVCDDVTQQATDALDYIDHHLANLADVYARQASQHLKEVFEALQETATDYHR